MRRVVASGFVAVIALFATSCSNANDVNPKIGHETDTEFPLSVAASNGHVEIPKKPERVISLSPTATESLFEVKAGAQVVAVDNMSNYPAEAPKTDLSGFTPNAEAVVGYKPDLVVIMNDANGLLAALRQASIPVLVQPAATTFDDAYKQIKDIGLATGHYAEAEKVVGDLKYKINDASVKAPKPTPALRYYHEVDNTFYSTTSKSFIGQVYNLFALSNIADAVAKDNPYPQLSGEYIVSSNPDLIFLADTKCCAQTPEVVAQRPGWSNINAVKTGSVVSLDDDIASRWGPRIDDLVISVSNAVKTHEERANK